MGDESHISATANATQPANRRARWAWNAARVLTAAGVIHFSFSIALWGFFYFACYRAQWNHVFTFSYAARFVLPAAVLLGLFVWATVGMFRRQRLAVLLLAGSTLLSAGLFAADMSDEPQLVRIWFEENAACSTRQRLYITWWWWNPTDR